MEIKTFTFDLNIYSLATIKKAGLQFAGHFVVEVEKDGSHVKVELSPKTALPFEGPDAASFPNYVLDQDLREIIATETQSVTELLLAQAFTKMSLTDPVSDDAAIGDDPHGIASATGPAQMRNDLR